MIKLNNEDVFVESNILNGMGFSEVVLYVNQGVVKKAGLRIGDLIVPWMSIDRTDKIKEDGVKYYRISTRWDPQPGMDTRKAILKYAVDKLQGTGLIQSSRIYISDREQ